MNTMLNRTLMRVALVWVLALTPSLGGATDWDLVREQVPFSERANVAVALVRSDEGDSFRVYVDDDGNVRGMLSLRVGFNKFSEPVCPTYQIDERPPLVVGLSDELCSLEINKAHFWFGKQKGRKILSTPLHRLMNGKAVVFRFRLDSIGYRQSTFSLRRSKFAVEGAIGSGVKIEKE
jgi:hypothetical protein